MTLHVGILTRDGLIVAADKRTGFTNAGEQESEARRFQDDCVKVHRIGPAAGFNVTGLGGVTLANGGGKIELEDAPKSFFDNYTGNFREPDLWKLVSKHILRAMQGLLDFIPVEDFPVMPINRGHVEFQFYFLAGPTVFRYLSLHFRLDHMRRQFGCRWFPAQQDVMDPTKLNAAGAVDVIAEIKTGSDSRFADLRIDRLYRQFIRLENPPRARDLPQTEGLRLCRRIIADTSNRLSFLNQPPGVSEDYDAALISFRDGWKWLKH